VRLVWGSNYGLKLTLGKLARKCGILKDSNEKSNFVRNGILLFTLLQKRVKGE
jgi:hypothetical protein